MHIVYVSREYVPSKRGGGIASYVKEMASTLVALGHKVTVVCASDDTNSVDGPKFYVNGKVLGSDKVEDGIRVIRLLGGDFIIPEEEGKSIIKKFRILYRFWTYRRKLVECLKNIDNVDIIEVPEFGAESLYFDELNVPYVIRLHGPILLNHYNFTKFGITKRNAPFYIPQLQELKEMEKAKYITSCSTSLKEWSEKYTSVKSSCINVIWNPVNLRLSSYKGNVVNKSKQSDTKTVLFAGTVCDWKGCEDLCEAGKLLNASEAGITYHVSFVGKMGIFANKLKVRYSKEAWLDMVGLIPRQELQKRYTDADVVIFPSWWENMPMVCIEAMLQGAVVIGSNSGGMSEIIEDGVSGWLVEPRDPKKIADAIRRATTMTDEERQRMSKAAHDRIVNYFSTDVIVKQMLEYYEFVIEDFKKK